VLNYLYEVIRACSELGSLQPSLPAEATALFAELIGQFSEAKRCFIEKCVGNLASNQLVGESIGLLEAIIDS